MSRLSVFRFTGLLFAVLASFALAPASAFAADLAATASVSSATLGVGQPVTLELKVTGAEHSVRPPDIAVDGLDIRYAATQSSGGFVFGFGSGAGVTRERSTSYVYQIQAQRPGTFTIPALTIEADGKRATTEPITLTVQQGKATDPGATEQFGFAEIVLGKTSAYLGEVVPVEYRLHVDARVPSEADSMPELDGEGFTKQKLLQPREERARRDGRDYKVYVFRTTITAGRAGKLEIGPAKSTFRAQVPRAQQRTRRGLLFDFFGDDDIFGDPFFSQVRRIAVSAPAVELQIKPLPTEGRPTDFSGAVGEFRLAAEGTPKQVKVGDPISMKVAVSGRGNFDRIEAPVITERSGWRTYPPSNSFRPDDELNLSGTKTFEVAVIPETVKTAMPQFAFTYFEPTAEKYVTLTTAAAPLTVEPGSAPTPAVVPVPSVRSEEPKHETARAAAADIVGLRYDAGPRRNSFEPLYVLRSFWLVQLVPLAAFVACILLRKPRRQANKDQRAALRQERARLHAKLGSEMLSNAEFYEGATRIVQLDTALRTGGEPTSIDAATAAKALGANEVQAHQLDEIFSARAELLYAGSGGGDGSISSDARGRVLSTLSGIGGRW